MINSGGKRWRSNDIFCIRCNYRAVALSAIGVNVTVPNGLTGDVFRMRQFAGRELAFAPRYLHSMGSANLCRAGDA